MAAPMLGVARQGGTFYQVTQTALGGSGTNSLYGPIERELQRVEAQGIWERVGSLAAQLGDDIFMSVAPGNATPRIYKGFDGAILLKVSADPTPTLPLSGETVTQGGVTGTLVEDYIAGDNYFVVSGETGGTFAAGGITFSAGSPATVTSREANGGQFAIDFQSAITSHFSFSVESRRGSGLHHGLKNGVPTLGMMFIANDGPGNGGSIWTLIRNPSSGLWDENDSGVDFPNVFDANGGSVVHRNTIYWIEAGNGTSYTMTMSIETGVVTIGAIAIPSNKISHPIIWNGRILFSASHSNAAFRVYDISSGTPVVLISIPNVGDTWDTTEVGTLFVGPDDNALYIIVRSDNSINQVVRLYDDGSDIVLSCPAGAQANNTLDVSNALLPGSLKTGIAIASHGNTFLDIETTPGTKLQRIWHYNGSLVGGAEYLYLEHGLLDSGLAATVSGTIGNFDDLIFQNAPVLSVDDWIVLNVTGNVWSCYRVDAVATVNVQLANLTPVSTGGTAIPQPVPTAGTAEIRKVQALSSIAAAVGGLSGVALPHGTVGGGHLYTVGEVPGEFNAQLAAVGGVKLTFTIFDPQSNLVAGTGKARGYFLKEDGTFGQMTLLSVGQGTKNGNDNETLSAGAGQTFIWDNGADGVADGLFTDKFVFIFT